MFSFASKMLNTLMGEGEEGPGPGGVPQPRGPGPNRGQFQQAPLGPRLQQMTYPRPPAHHSPQPIYRESPFSNAPVSRVEPQPFRPHPTGGPDEPNLDLSHLSAEERALIQNVMAKAKDLEPTPPVPVKPPENQFRSMSQNMEERPATYGMASGSYMGQQSMSYNQPDSFQSQMMPKPQDPYRQGSNVFQDYTQQKESNNFTSNFQTPTSSYQSGPSYQDLSSNNQNTNQRLDSYQPKQESQSQGSFQSPQRKEFSLQRQESQRDVQKPFSSFYNSPVLSIHRGAKKKNGDDMEPSGHLLRPIKKGSLSRMMGMVKSIPFLRAQMNLQNENSSLTPSLQSSFRSNNNFGTLNQNTLRTNTSFNQPGHGQEKSNGNISEKDALSSMHRQNEYLSDNKRTSELGESRYQSFLDRQSGRSDQPMSPFMQQQQQQQQMKTDSLASRHESLEKQFQSSLSIKPQNEHQMQHPMNPGSQQQVSQQQSFQQKPPFLQQHTQLQQHTTPLLHGLLQQPQQQQHQQAQQSQLQQQHQSQLQQQHQQQQQQQQQQHQMQDQQQSQSPYHQHQISLQQQPLLHQQVPPQNPQQQLLQQQNMPYQQQQQSQISQQQQQGQLPQHQQQGQMPHHQQQGQMPQHQQQGQMPQHQQQGQMPHHQQQGQMPQHQQQGQMPQHQQQSIHSQNMQQQLHSQNMQQQIHSQNMQPQQNIQQGPMFNLQSSNPLQRQQNQPSVSMGNQPLSQNFNQPQMSNLEKKLSQSMQPNMQQQSMQQQSPRQQQEMQHLQMKKFQQMQRQQLISRVNTRTPLLQQGRQSFDGNFPMKSEAGFFPHEDSWRGYSEFPEGLYGKDYTLDQKARAQERALGYQNDMDDGFNLDKQNSQQNNAQAKSSAGTISGMLADFSRALGLGNASDEKHDEQTTQRSDNKDLIQPQTQKSLSQQQIQAQIRANEQFIHGQQTHSPLDFHNAQSTQIRNQNDQKMQQAQQMQQNQQMQQQAQQPQHLQQGTQYQMNQPQMPIDYPMFQQPGQPIQLMTQQGLMQHKLQAFLKDDFMSTLDNEQKAMYIQQQLYQKLPENQPMFAHNLTPQQQQMYQQHMQLQHHAQHLKKIKRSLPSSALDQQRQAQGLGTGVTIQQMMAAQFLNQQPVHPVQLMNSQIVGADMSQSRLVSSSNPVLSSSLTASAINCVTPLTTPQSTPVGTPRGAKDGGDSSDTMSETDSQKSLRTRRKLPSIPADQEAITLPTAKKRDGRVKAKSPHDKFGRSFSPLRPLSDGGYRISSSSLMLQRPSSSETNLRKVSSFGPETVPRPGSALGLLQGSSVVSSSGLHSDFQRDSELASCLPPDLRYLLNSYKSSDPYSKQQLIQAYKDQLSGDKLSMPDRRSALNRLSSLDWEAERLLSRNKDLLRSPKSRLDIQRKIAYSGIRGTRKIRTHRRQLSDPKIHMEMNPIKDDPYNRGLALRPGYKSYEYESIDDNKLSEWDSSHPYLASYAIAGGALRETAINSVLDKDPITGDPLRYDMRRYSDSMDLRRRDGPKHSKPRSWQPSPYGSDEDDDQLSREQKKAKIKAEIARRRQQIEENARLHEELLRLARLRESAELGYAPVGNSPALTGEYAASVLKSIDDLIGREEYRTAEDRSMDRIASTFRTDDYTSNVYERLSDFSPVTDFSTPHAMPLLPDMPTRSRKLLEDLGSSPITDSVLTLPQKAKALL